MTLHPAVSEESTRLPWEAVPNRSISISLIQPLITMCVPSMPPPSS